MATSLFLSSASLLPVRREPAATSSISFSLKPRRFLSFSRIPPKPPCCSRIPCSPSGKPSTTATGVLSSVASASATFLFLLAASLLSLSGVRPPPALACAPPTTQEIEGQEDEQQESEECKKSEGVEVEEEVKLYSDILNRDPGDVDALKCALYAKMKSADWGGALEYVRGLREAEPDEVEWKLTEAQLHELKGDLAEAEQLFRDVLAEDPLHVRALHGLALCLHKKHEGPAVYEMLENALQLAISEERVPEERNIKLLIAQMHVVEGKLDAASEKLHSLISEDPRDFRPHLCQGIVYALSDKKEEANVHFDTYRSLVPDEFPDKSFINDIITAAKTESNDRVQKEFGSEFLWKK
ncbi:hypothetical protein EJB05_55448 [Eragrostis curvula]|uniref:Uncharacterized protein n=1 Tax=Eragrostis curvula TaxID=38414 RepID=A0A5J9SJQ1_9POAL|nr:hypothetical protein EJB05_55448 [Eragrostis curvula]